MSLLTIATGVGLTSENEISWNHAAETPVGSGTTLLVFVGGIDSQKPSVVSATLSGSEKSPTLPTQTLSTVIEATGAGGSSFPNGWITYVNNPFNTVTATGIVTGTVTVGFDETVGRMQGLSAIISGTSGAFDGVPVFTAQNTQWPGFAISHTHSTTAAGTLLVDLCISESSTHNDHIVGAGQTKFGDVLFGGPKISTSLEVTTTTGSYELSRSGCGGPFAGVSLISVALESV